MKAAYHGWLKAAAYLLDHGADVSVACFSIPGRTDLLNMSNGNAAHITPLMAAVMAGNKAMAQFLIDRGADVNFKGQNGDTPLHLAAQKCFQAVIEVLLASRADVKAQNTGGATPLCSAVQSGQVKIVRMLLAAGADGNVHDSKGRTVLNYAIGTSPDIIQALLAAGTNPNTEDSVGRTPLSYATERDSSTAVKLLLDAKADPNGGKLDAPLLCAIGKNDAASVELLLQAGANPNSIGKVDLPHQSDFGGRRSGPLGGGFGSSTPSVTPLWLAISDNQFPLVQLLLKFKADPNDSQIDGRSLLFSALSDTNILEALLDAGATVDAMGASANVRVGNSAVNLTPLGEAARLNNAAALETLLKHGANPNVRDPVGSFTPLHWAADFLADRKVFELLLVYKAERNTRDINGQTPLDILKEKAKADNLATDSAGKKKAGELADLLRQHGALDNLPN